MPATELYFTVVLPTYNRAHLISNSISSVLAQTFSDWELIVVDDGSTDNTQEVVKTFTDERIRYVHQENAERSAARNNGIQNARGKYICFLDSDDHFLPTHLELLFSSIEKTRNPIAMFVTDMLRYENNCPIVMPHQNPSEFVNNICYLLIGRESIIPPRVCIHRSILNELHFDTELSISEDTDLWVRVAAKYPLIMTRNATVAYVIHDSNSINMANNPFVGQLKALKKIFSNPGLQSFIPRHVKNQKLSTCYHGIARHYLLTQKYLLMCGYLLVSVWYHPTSRSTKSKIYLIVSEFPLVKWMRKEKSSP